MGLGSIKGSGLCQQSSCRVGKGATGEEMKCRTQEQLNCFSHRWKKRELACKENVCQDSILKIAFLQSEGKLRGKAESWNERKNRFLKRILPYLLIHSCSKLSHKIWKQEGQCFSTPHHTRRLFLWKISYPVIKFHKSDASSYPYPTTTYTERWSHF